MTDLQQTRLGLRPGPVAYSFLQRLTADCLFRTEQKFISLLITNDTTNILSLSQKSKFATGSCEWTSGLRVEQQPYINKFTRKTKTKSI